MVLMEKEKNAFKRKKLPILFVLFCMVPSCILVLAFYVIPTVRSVGLSFQTVSALTLQGKWVGLSNYTKLLNDTYFRKAFLNTLKLLFVVPVFTITTAFILAFTLQQSKLREKQMYITAFFLPTITSATIVSIIWKYVFHPTSGVLNTLLSILSLNTWKHTWLGETETALWCIGLVIYISSFGYYMVLHMVGMTDISPDIYESAVIDGAGFWTKLTKITLPLMKNVLGVTTILSMSSVLNASFTYCLLLTNGNPNGASSVLLQYSYQQGMVNGNMGYASAISVVTIIVAVILSSISRAITSKEA